MLKGGLRGATVGGGSTSHVFLDLDEGPIALPLVIVFNLENNSEFRTIFCMLTFYWDILILRDNYVYLYPTKDWGSPQAAGSNEHGLVLSQQTFRSSVLVPGLYRESTRLI